MTGAKVGSVETHCAAARISQCSTCKTPLPLCEAVEPEDGRNWLCNGCGAGFRAMLAPDYSIDELRGVRPEAVIFDQPSMQPVAPDMLAFAHNLSARSVTNVEKRSSTRHAVVATLKALSVDDRLRPMGPAFHTICRNLSVGGICLINDRPIHSEFLVIDLSFAGGSPMQTLARVLRRRPLGPYHDIGSEFVTKLAEPSSAGTGE